MRHAVVALLLLAPGVAWTQAEVISPRPDSVSVTIYRDLIAVVTETRTVDLPAEAVTLAFDGVVDTLIPASAMVSDLDRDIEERNYDYEALAPANLLRRSVGRRVMLTRTAPGSGQVTQVPAIITSATDDGVMLQTADGHEALQCSGIPESLTFEEVPGDLHPTPRLSIRLSAGHAGKRVIKLSYIAQGFAWSSDYVATLAANGRSMDLTGWVTLRNLTNASFRDAAVQVVAGRLNLLHEDDRGSSPIGATADFGSEQELQQARDNVLSELNEAMKAEAMDLAFLRGCYPMGAPRPRVAREKFERTRRFGSSQFDGGYFGGELDEVVVTGMRASITGPEMLADYHLYRIPWPTDLNARQTKQVVFLQQEHVKIQRFYGFKFDPEDIDDYQDEDEEAPRPRVMLAFDNRKSAGLGMPLPGGMFRLFETAASSPVFAGETPMGDKAVDLPIELTLGRATDLSLELLAEEIEDSDHEEGDVIVRAYNAKAWPVQLEIRQPPSDGDVAFEVVASTHRMRRKFGDLMWRVTVPANSATELRYRLRSE